MELLEFQHVMEETIKTLPDQFREKLEGVVICIESLPASGSRSLLGLYEGVPITAPGLRNYSGKLPDKITLYLMNIEAHARSPEEVPHIIRETLLHEIGHHFGLDHDRIGKMEKRWRTNRK